MVDIYGSHFEYAGVSSRRYGLIIANAETKRNTSLSGSIKGVTVFNKATKSNSLVDNDYSNSPISIDIEFVTDDEVPLSRRDMHEVEKWLFNRATYKKLYIDEADDIFGETHELIDGVQKRLYLNCRFVNPSRLEYNNGVVGYKATLEADSGYWWQDAITRTYSRGDPDVSCGDTGYQKNIMLFNVRTDTDIDDYINPNMSFTTGSASDNEVVVINLSDEINSVMNSILAKVNDMISSDNPAYISSAYLLLVAQALLTRRTSFLHVPANTTVSVNGIVNGISKSGSNDYDAYGNFAHRHFPRLLDGDNYILVIGKVQAVSFEFNNRRML